ncbi:PEP-CTERM sorting domain-containing protein [Tautonia sociabilis]|uniref:PEP-CTERM sorting domain-containing protein n=1 Tax=Tautonia sociabilis TaxID=2080755 RepID=A0A432MIY9_9BACT|nr:PEP-CTERM sorting domain-containing protein [Tautonia sociabilis]
MSLSSRFTLALAVVFSTSGRPASAESLGSRFTREDGMNAVRFAGQSWTLPELIDRRAQNPMRFDRSHGRLGSALRLGIDGLQARRALNPRRFDSYHPVLAYLLDDFLPDAPIDGTSSSAGGSAGGSGNLLPGGGSLSSPVDEPATPLPAGGSGPLAPTGPGAQTPSLPSDDSGELGTLPGEDAGSSTIPPPPGNGGAAGGSGSGSNGGNHGGTPVGSDGDPSGSAVPEPPGLILLGIGLAGLLGRAARQRARARSRREPAPG